MALTIIGVMGPGSGATEIDIKRAHRLGALIAAKGWAILTGGRYEGVMHAALQGAKLQLCNLARSHRVDRHCDLTF